MDTIDVQIKHVTATIQTLKNTNIKSTNIDLGDRIIQSVDILFAPGHVALTGVRLMLNDVAILPWNQPTQFIFGDNERLAFQLGIYVPGILTIQTHNSDTVTHMHQITFYLTEVPAQVPDSYRAGPLVLA
jgi:hypothetical protein